MSDTTPATSEQTAPKLSTKQRAFVEHYLTCWNGAEAARRAGYSAKTAHEQAARLLASVSIKSLVSERIKELKADADEVLLRLADHARGTIEDFIDDAGELSLKQARERRKLHLVKKLKQTTRTDKDGQRFVILEAELYDAQAATVQLGRALGLFVDRQEVTGKDGGPIELADIKARLLSRFSQDDAERGAPGVPEPPAG